MKQLQELKSLVESRHAEWAEMAQSIWNHPELSMQEHFACKTQVEMLRKMGYEVTTPYCGLETSYRAEFATDPNGPVFAYCSEYDALPGIGHGCTHNLMCTATMAAAYATKCLMEKEGIKGRIVILGTPAEEYLGGKCLMEKAGCLKDLTAVMMVHGSWRNSPDPGSTSIMSYDVVFHGKATHAAGAPEKGINALDAVMLVFSAVNAWRQQLPEDTRIHGVITHGGDAPNIIPQEASCFFYLRAYRDEWNAPMVKRFMDIIHGAELMTGATATITEHQPIYRASKPNQPMNQLYIQAMEELGVKVEHNPKPGRGSTDFGNFSQVLPGIHPYFAVADHQVPGHSVELAECSRSQLGLEGALNAAAAMSFIGCTYLTSPDFRAQVQNDFDRK